MRGLLIRKIKIVFLVFIITPVCISCIDTRPANQNNSKPLLCILGGTPSSTAILNLIPDSIKSAYNVVSFNRPGFGGTENTSMTLALLFKLAAAAGIKNNDFGIIGISGGAPLAILIATKFKLKHCGIISGMVSKEAFFQYADKAVTKGIMQSALGNYADFKAAAIRFPNLSEIVKQAGAPSEEIALRACYDELNFVLSDQLFPSLPLNRLSIDWWHGESDVNVPVESAELFLKHFPNARLNWIAGADHGIDAGVYVSKIITHWN